MLATLVFVMGQIYMCILIWYTEENDIFVFLPKMHNLLMMMKPVNPKVKNTLQSNTPTLYTNVKAMKVRKDRNISRQKETKKKM